MDQTPLIHQYVQLRSQFMSYLYAIARDAELAEEIYQNAAIVVIEKAAEQEKIRDFRAWAKEVVRRQAFHAIRAREVSTRHSRVMSPELLEAVSDLFLQEESEDSVASDEAGALRQCLDALPPDKRKLVAMRYEGRFSFEDISESTGSTPTAVQRALSRIRKMLHGCIQQRIQRQEQAT